MSVVETCEGRLRGTFVDGVHVFRGVRYGESTGGPNRFRPPVRARHWAGIRDASTPGASAPQSPVRENTDPFFSWYSAIEPVSEDCLFLNVFTPRVGPGPRPVMVWVHGGGWREYAGTAPGFDGTALARAEDVVVVTVNHRLNVFGYIRLEDDERFADAGNAGLLDLIAALGWVRDNAAAFGGDPANVTIFGESGGASKIAAMLSVRAARGLFHKAVLQSSAGGLLVATEEEAARQAARLASVLGWGRLDGRRLQSLTMPQLIEATRQAGGPFRGAVDGRTCDEGPFDGRAPESASDVPLLAGCTDTETTYYLRNDASNFALDLREAKRRLARFLGLEASGVDQLVAAYRDVYPDAGPSELLVRVSSDFVFKRNTYRMAALQAATACAPVYAYLFARRTPVEGGRMGSPHTSEVPFIFGTTAAAAACVGSGTDLVPMTQRMMACWAAFARNGDPNNATVPTWSPLTPAAPTTMVLDTASEAASNPGGPARAALEGLPYFGYGHFIPALVGA